MAEINLGDRVKDTVSGWEGVATARYEYMNGCIRYVIDGVDKDGKPAGFVFDEEQVVAIPGEVAVERAASSRTGGERDNTPSPR